MDSVSLRTDSTTAKWDGECNEPSHVNCAICVTEYHVIMRSREKDNTYRCYRSPHRPIGRWGCLGDEVVHGVTNAELGAVIVRNS